jgi:rRNA maturation protein Nop10
VGRSVARRGHRRRAGEGMIRGTCPTCGVTVDSPSPRRFCSKACYREHIRAKPIPPKPEPEKCPETGAIAVIAGQRVALPLPDAEREKARHSQFWADPWAMLLAFPPCKRLAPQTEHSHPGPHRRGH